MTKIPKRCAFEGCLTFLGKGCRKYCAEHSFKVNRASKNQKGKSKNGGKKPGTNPNPYKRQVGRSAPNMSDVGIMSISNENQILRSIFGGQR